jgi:hypothetical protein
MSWNTFHISLEPGASISWGYGWGDDHGSQHAQAREFNDSFRGNPLTVTKESIIRNADSSISYVVDIVNEGPNPATFELVGGGVT